MLPDDLLSKHFRIDLAHVRALKRLSITSVGDLLLHLPMRYEDTAAIQTIESVSKGQDVIVYGQIGGLKTRKAWKSRVPIAEGWIEDGTARMKIMWFNQPYIAKMLTDGAYVKLTGKIAGSDPKLYLANPEIERLESLPIDRHNSIFNKGETREETLYPVYAETKGVTSKWFFHTVQKCFEKGVLQEFHDPIPEAIRTRYHLPDLKTALIWIHTPKKAEHAESARKRFAFEEVFCIQTAKAMERHAADSEMNYQIKTDGTHIKKFTERFPFPLTGAQQKAIETILKDFDGKHAMSRLLEGDVGSGKTAVAATTAYAVATSRPPEGLENSAGSSKKSGLKNIEYGTLQVAYMAPTEILAKQQFESFITYFHHLPIHIGLLTGSECMKFPSKVTPTKPTKISKTQLLKWVKNGEIPILIGTHALIYKSVSFKHLAHVIIDEQHRFGTSQRRALAKKDSSALWRMPHLLSMTATPIPRTLALTVYGDLDLSLLDEMPKGRKPVITTVVAPSQTSDMYDHAREELKNGRQLYVICPRIEEPDETKENALLIKSVAEEARRLKEKVFTHARIAILHSKMKPKEKDDVMKQFLSHEIDVLVATSVVEVGVNVPNATLIIIEGAERFGLAQLHQLRGRVLRGTHQAYCYAVTSKDSQSKSGRSLERLKALVSAKNGFELAEYDLTLRGAGELYGMKQWGISDVGMEALKNIKLVEAARKEAQELVLRDPNLDSHPLIREKIASLKADLHME